MACVGGTSSFARRSVGRASVKVAARLRIVNKRVAPAATPERPFTVTPFQTPMAHRTFTDEDGVVWAVWDVVPTSTERRLGGRRLNLTPEQGRQIGLGTADRRRTERRVMQTEPRPRVALGLEKGWLVFESATERRRLAPIPEHWEELPDSALPALRDTATSLPPRQRLIE